MGLKHYFFFFSTFLVKIFWPQFASCQLIIGPQLGVKEPVQQLNPAAFIGGRHTSLQCQGAFVAQLPGLQQLAVNLSLPRQRLSLQQHFSYHGIQSFQYLTYINTVGIALSPELKVGLGIGVQAFFQGAYYGTKWSALVKFGLQYQLDQHQYFGLTFELNSPFEQAAFKWAYANQMSPELICYAHVVWYQTLPPQFFIGFEQKINNYFVQCTAALQPQLFGLVLSKQSQQHLMWSIGLQWQNRVGLGLIWGLKLNKK